LQQKILMEIFFELILTAFGILFNNFLLSQVSIKFLHQVDRLVLPNENLYKLDSFKIITEHSVQTKVFTFS